MLLIPSLSDLLIIRYAFAPVLHLTRTSTLLINAGAVLKFRLGDAPPIGDLSGPPTLLQRFKVSNDLDFFSTHEVKELLRNLRFLRTLIAFWNVFLLLLMITYALLTILTLL